MRIIVMATALLAAFPAMATNGVHVGNSSTNYNKAYGGSANSHSHSNSNSRSSSRNANQVNQYDGATNNTINHRVEAQPRAPVSSAYAAPIAPTAVCMGTSSAGAQGVAVGLSFGTSWTDANCMLLEQVRSVAVVLGDPMTAEEMMCGADTYREARLRMGNPCRSSQKAKVKQTEYRDPYIRSRLALPPIPPIEEEEN